MRLQEQIVDCGFTNKQFAQEIKTDAPTVSRFVKYKCLPIPEMMKDICNVLNCEVEQIYSKDEIYYKSSEKSRKIKREHYKLTVSLPKDAQDFFKKALKKCGYRDITDWVMKCYLRLQKRYEIIIEAERKKEKL